MNVLVVYDVATHDREGVRRLRRVAKVCEGYGQRVQYSVFEVVCSRTGLERLLARLDSVIDHAEDSLRVYLISSSSFDDVRKLGRTSELPQQQAWTL